MRTVGKSIAIAIVEDTIADISLHPGARHLDDTAILHRHGELLEDASWNIRSLGESRRIAFTQEVVEGLRTDQSHEGPSAVLHLTNPKRLANELV